MIASTLLKSKGSTIKYVFGKLKFDMLNSIENRMKLKIDFMHTSWNSLMLLFLLSTCYKLNGPLKRDEYYVFQNKEKASNTNVLMYIKIMLYVFHVIRNKVFYTLSIPKFCINIHFIIVALFNQVNKIWTNYFWLN